MKTVGMLVAVILVAALVTPVPGRGDELSESYYPLKEGLRWEYQVTSDQGPTQKLIITNLAPREVNGKKVTPRQWEIGGHKYLEFMEKDDSGIYRYAEQADLKAPPKVLSPKECHLKFPVAPGSSWNMSTTVGDSPLQVSLTLESVSDEVKVPAGAFRDCIEVKQIGENDAGLSVKGYEWYAPKVGVVKSMVSIKRKQGAPASEHRMYQLQSFK